MDGFFPRVRSTTAVAAGFAGLGLASWNWLYFLMAPPGRLYCGNCLLGGIGISAELALLSLVLAWRGLRGGQILRRDGIWWFGALIGAYFTSYVVGLPLFVWSLVELVWPDLD